MLINQLDTTRLKCEAQGQPTPVVDWFFRDQPIKDGTLFRLHDKGQQLEIKEVQADNEGVYKCIAKNEAGSDSAEVHLVVGSFPTFTEKPTSIKARILSNVTIPCLGVGSPVPAVKWSFSSKQADRINQLPNGALSITSIRREDEGSYTCVLENRFGSVNATAIISVDGIIAPRIEYSNPTEYVLLGRDASISCRIYGGFPPPKVEWLKDGVKLRNGSRIYVGSYNNIVISQTRVSIFFIDYLVLLPTYFYCLSKA